MTPIIAVPVKRFYVAKRRLSPVLDAPTRSRLGRDLAAHTLGVIREAGFDPTVLAADAEVVEWASGTGTGAIVDGAGGLNEACLTLAHHAERDGRPWMVVHADLPLLTAAEVREAVDLLAGGTPVLAPSKDSGTSLVGGDRPLAFSYGPGSFHRHLAALGNATVLVRVGLALDLDDASDLAVARRHGRGQWLDEYVPGPH